MNVLRLALIITAVALFVVAADHSATSAAELPKITAVGEVLFSHDMHVDELELECTECHHQTNAVALDFPHETYFEDFWIDCHSCHGEDSDGDPQACSNCHHGYSADIANETLSSKVVIHQKCWSCHEVGTGTEASESCIMCHEGLSALDPELEP